MVGRLFAAVLLLAASTVSVLAQSTCGNGVQCPKDSPCCSAYGACGVGAYCFAGCDPINSYSLEACMPAPVCKSGTWEFNNLDTVQANTKYLGDASKADWVSSGQPLAYNGQLLLTMAQGTVGTLLKTTRYVWYGKVTGKFRTSAGKGVVTAFILLGDAKDEIDFEFVGSDLKTAQTNFYSLGVTNYGNGKYVSGLNPDSYTGTHTYEIDWQQDSISWTIDGQQVRTLQRKDTWNATSNRYSFPQTPSQVQLSLWPAGLSSNGEGTITWAGGLIDWSSQYMTNNYYYAAFDSVTIQCYDPPAGVRKTGSNSYVFTDKLLTNQSVTISDRSTILGSFSATGLNPGSSTGTNTSAASIPGVIGTTNDANRPSNGTNSTSTSTSSGGTNGGSNNGGSGNSGSKTGAGSASTGFVQGSGGSNTGGASPTVGNPEKVLQGSLFAVIVAIASLIVL